MEAMSNTCFLVSMNLILVLFFLLKPNHTMASDRLSLGQSLSGKLTLISNDGNFALGFFSPGNSSKFYIGIWYNKLPGQTIIWVANRESPTSDPTTSKLQISDLGELVLLNSSNSLIWSSNSTRKATTAILLDTGNLVLRNDSTSEVDLWQSFAHPTDTWMPGGWLGVNKITGEYQRLTSWKNSEDPAPGIFAESMDPDGSNQYVLIWNGSNIYWTSGIWNGQYFPNIPATTESTVFNLSFVDDKQRKFSSYLINVKSFITRFVLGSDGQGKQSYWLSDRQQWQTVNTLPLAHCDVYSLCGPFGICDSMNMDSICGCPEGFQPASLKEWALSDWSLGCSRKTQLQCQADGFLPMYNLRLPAKPNSFKLRRYEECRDACLNDCSCTAYSYDNVCSIWNGGIRNLQQLHEGDNGGRTIYLRLAASDLPSSSGSGAKVVKVVLSSVAGVVTILFIAYCLMKVYERTKRAQTLRKLDNSLVKFSYTDLQRITRNFSEKLGSGGFGSVFKGTLPNSIQVAVKKLEGLRQGEKQFRAEVSTLGVIQHVNLVRLYGFCSGGNKRLLVYEYMPKGSLDAHLFLNESTELDWERRFQIILGTARGLAYLHEECRECIVHCDVKPDNVLLDAEFNPKVSDFGMAKLIGRDFSKVLTTMRGTIGYLAPEWIAGMPITPKVDVYSFGMMVFEVISGKRNNMHSEDGSMAIYPFWAAKKVVEGSVVSLLDSRLKGVVDLEQVTRVSRIACWCIQDLESQRPSMGKIVQILEGALDVDEPPLPHSLQNLTESV